MPTQNLEIPRIALQWTDWYEWREFKKDRRSDPEALNVPSESGVYEARLKGSDERLAIGKASDLRMRVKQGFVKGKTANSFGQKVRDGEDVSQVVIRWALTDRPACCQEELYRLHQQEHGQLPKYAEHIA